MHSILYRTCRRTAPVSRLGAVTRAASIATPPFSQSNTITVSARTRTPGFQSYHSWVVSDSTQGLREKGIRSLSTATKASPDDRWRQEQERLLVVGSGVAGCAAALIAAVRHKVPVTLVYAGSVPVDCNSYWAQGGIIYRNYNPESGDSAASLVQDVHRAGAGLCVDAAVQKLALEGPDLVRELLLGSHPEFADVPFDRHADTGELSCCLEASHAAPRIIHFADHTGQAITDHITRAALAHPLITTVSDTIVTDLITFPDPDLCVGAEVMHRVSGKRQSLYATRGVLLASGGLGGIYEHSTNPTGFNALGSSVGLAKRANAKTKDLEYVQFHPTALCIPRQSRFLLSEALRGEGAILRDATGRAFAKDFHSDGELAPRDVVARGVYDESQKGSSDKHNVYLDITHRDADWLRKRFPSIDAHLRSKGLDITKDMLPVIPAAHYTCGGIETDLDGRTSLAGLYSAGEAARTGLHGGNRLASTSLLEGLVYGAAVAEHVGSSEESEYISNKIRRIVDSPTLNRLGEDEAWWKSRAERYYVNGEAKATRLAAMELLAKLRRIMWNHVGLVRTPLGLQKAIDGLEAIRGEATYMFAQCPTVETAGLRDAAHAGKAVAQAAHANRVSAGTHYIVEDNMADIANSHYGNDVDSDESSSDDDEEVVVMAAYGR